MVEVTTEGPDAKSTGAGPLASSHQHLPLHEEHLQRQAKNTFTDAVAGQPLSYKELVFLFRRFSQNCLTPQ